MMSIPSTVIYFVGYDMLREWTRSSTLVQQHDTLNLMPFVTGAAARSTFFQLSKKEGGKADKI